MPQQYKQDISNMLSALNIDEEAVKCHLCEKEVHSGCRPQLDDIWNNLPFTCGSCMTKLRLHRTRKFRACELPENVLSKQIEKSIKELLHNNGAGDEKVTIRTFLKDFKANYDIGTDT